MNQGTMDRPTFEVIEAYVLERMNPAEQEAFEQRMAVDPALRAEVKLERDNIRAVELGGVVRAMKQITAEEATETTTTGGRRSLLAYAAAVAVLIIGALWWIDRPTDHERLFAAHFEADPGLPVAMGVTDDPVFADAMVSYKEGLFADARSKWSPLLQQEPMNDTLRYYIASAWLAEGNAPNAIPLLLDLADEPASAFHVKAQWFLFLAYLRTDEIAQAQAMEFVNDSTYGDRVRAIKGQLKAE